MMPSIARHADSKASTTKQNVSNKEVVHLPAIQTKYFNSIESYAFKTGKKSLQAAFQCADVDSGNKALLSDERKLQDRLKDDDSRKSFIQCNVALKRTAQNNSLLKSSNASTRQNLPSRIPVLKKRVNMKHKQNDCIQSDIMTAADRRQKFHQSRLGVAPENVCSTSTCHFLGKQNAPSMNIIPYYAVNYNTQVHRPCPVVLNISPKTALPCIKPTTASNIASANVHNVKKKCLLGEITHFPALCNGLRPKTQPKVFISSVPHLPPIHPIQEPVVPPPSLSTSVENEGHKVHKDTLKI